MFLLSVLVSVLLPLSRAEQQILSKESNPFNSKFGELAQETLDYWHVPGLAIGVVDGNDTWTEGYGIATYPSTPVTPSTNFYAGSTSKAFTAAALALLIDNHTSFPSLAWTTPISSIIRDDFVLEDAWATTHLTIEDALSHRTGMPRHDLAYGGHYLDGDLSGAGRGKGEGGVHKGTVRDVVRSLRWLPATAEPRTTWQYCNMMFVVTSHVVETLTGIWLGDFLKDKIWGPLSMDGTYFSTPDALKSSQPLAQGYVYHNEKYQEVPYMDFSGAGSVISNVIDYTKWLRCLLTSSLPLSPAGHAAIKTPRMLMPSEPNSPFTGPQAYALGWITGVYRGYEYFEHSGGMEAFGTQLIFFPVLNYGLVSFGNTATTSNFAGLRLIWHLVDQKLGIPEDERFDWNKKNKAVIKGVATKYNNASELLYPHSPDPPVPLSLPLEKYTGTYFNPGYRNMTIVVKDGRLHCDRNDASWRLFFDFEHVSGEYFIMYGDSSTAPGLVFKDAMAAQFVVGSDGVPNKFGFDGAADTGSVRIWFDRI